MLRRRGLTGFARAGTRGDQGGAGVEHRRLPQAVTAIKRQPVSAPSRTRCRTKRTRAGMSLRVSLHKRQTPTVTVEPLAPATQLLCDTIAATVRSKSSSHTHYLDGWVSAHPCLSLVSPGTQKLQLTTRTGAVRARNDLDEVCMHDLRASDTRYSLLVLILAGFMPSRDVQMEARDVCFPQMHSGVAGVEIPKLALIQRLLHPDKRYAISALHLHRHAPRSHELC